MSSSDPADRSTAWLLKPPSGTPPNDAAALARDSPWGDQFRAVERTLGRIAAELPEPARPRVEAQDGQDSQDSASMLLDCISVLGDLHDQAMDEFERLRRSEAEVDTVRADLAQSRHEETHARHLSRHDFLTALPNRHAMHERLDQLTSRRGHAQTSLAVLFIDLDDFKHVNDRLGHAVGDEVLRIVAMRLARALRADDLVSRLGGDEFVCLVAGIPGREHLSHLACKLLEAVSAPLKIGASELSIRPSIGIATWPDDGRSPELLLSNADTAMYAAKLQRRGYAFAGAAPARGD